MKVSLGRKNSMMPQRFSKPEPKDDSRMVQLFEELQRKVEDRLNAPKAMELPPLEQPIKIIEREIKTINVTHENTKTIDKRARQYAKAVRKQLEADQKQADYDTTNIINRLQEVELEIDRLKSKKPEEKQVVTVQTRTIETVKEIEYKLDKRIIALLGLSLALNVLILILK